MNNLIKIYVVGDSTVSSFNDYTYFYPRYGYGTQLEECFCNAKVINLALSGRSSKSFIQEKNYQKLIDEMSNGDYLLIGFGHNDEKYDDETRFTDATKPIDDATSFKYSLYNNYIKKAQAVGATPILCTPIVRICKDNNYVGSSIHDTKYGNYQEAIKSLASELGLLSIDLTSYSLADAKRLGYERVAFQHAMTTGTMIDGRLVADTKSVDKTHLNYLGAKVMAYYVAKEISKSNLALKEYVKLDIKYPDDSVLQMNPEYIMPVYKEPKIASYEPNSNFDTKSNEWFGTAFGALDELPTAASSYLARKSDLGYLVGQYSKTNHGGIIMSCDGIAGVFKQIPIKYNFKFKCKATIKELQYASQSGFGLMLRDDMYLNQDEAKKVIASNYVCAGVLTDANGFAINYKRESSTEITRSEFYVNYQYQINDEFGFEIERLGQRITVKTIYKNKEYFNEYLDFDLVAIDGNYMYLGMFATKGIVVEYTNTEFEITGTSQGA